MMMVKIRTSIIKMTMMTMVPRKLSLLCGLWVGDDSDDNVMKKMTTMIEMVMMKMRANRIKMIMMTMVPRQLSLLCGGSLPRYFSVLRELGIE